MDRLKSPLRVVNTLALLVIAYAMLAQPSVAAPTTAPLQVPIGPAFEYNGTLGTASGRYDFQFRLFEVPTGGSPVLSTTSSAPNVLVDQGDYRVILKFGEDVKAWLTGRALYLEVKYRAATTNPSAPYTTLPGNRPQLMPVAYALGLRPGSISKGNVPCCGKAIFRADNASSGVGLWGSSLSNSGVYGETQAAQSDLIAGVYGRSNGDGGVGVIGEAPNGNSFGVLGISRGGSGVYGQATTGAAVVGNNINGGTAMKAQGHAVQSPGYGGWAKALLRFQGDGSFVSCYNGVTGVKGSLAQCGFSITNTGTGVYTIDFGSNIATQYHFFSLSGSSSLYLLGYPGTTSVQVQVGNNTSGYAYYILVF